MNRDETSRVVLSLMHSFFCKASHDEDSCEFYEEIELADCWDLPATQTWVTITMIVLGKLKIEERDLLIALKKVSKQLSNLAALNNAEKRLFDSIYREADLSYVIPEESLVDEVPLPIETNEETVDLSREYRKLVYLDDHARKR